MFKKSNMLRGGVSRVLALVVALTLALGTAPLAAMADTTIEGNGETNISLTTTVPELSSITVTPPTKTQYNVGEDLDTAGMAVTASYTDGTTKDVTSAATLSAFDSSAAGEVRVTVSYTEDGVTKTASFTVTIIAPVTTYTVTVQPGEGTGTAFTVDSSTVISRAEMLAGSYDQTKGCFYLDDDGKVYYRLPPQCSFTAPEGKEFDCWECSFGGTFSGGSFPVETYGNFTITALWKEVEEQSSVTLSIPATINVNYGDTQTAFDIQVKSVTFRQEDTGVYVKFYNSSFSNSENDGIIPFSMSTNSESFGTFNGGVAVEIKQTTTLPYTCQGFINITSDAWAAAKPGSYTATLRIQAQWL